MPDAMCVFCRERPADPKWRPFCSERCRLLDLARWVDGNYRVPGESVARPGGAGKSGKTETNDDNDWDER